jgi:UMF1 family MFS transporter
VSQPPASKSEIFGWAMFDFANSSYTTVIVTVVYSIVFPRLIVADAPEFALGNLYWSVALSISYGLCALTAPMLGVMMDHAGHKKRWLAFSWLLTVVTTTGLWFAEPGAVGMAILLVVLSNYGFSIGESFAASFLPDLGPPEALGRISGMAWGLGYLGGLSCTALVLFGLPDSTPDVYDGERMIGPVTGAFFFFAALPTFLLVRERGVPRPLPAGETYASVGFTSLARTMRDLRGFRDLSVFFASYFFAMAALSIVVAFAFIYGDQVIHWSNLTKTLMFVVTQLTAAMGALGFGWLQSRAGDMRTFMVTLVVWTLTVGMIAYAQPLAAALGLHPENLFLVVGCFAGACLGATQSAARTIVALFAPDHRVGEFFGLWGVFGKLAAIFGLLSLGFLQARLGLENAILLCGVFYLIALGIAFFVDETRAKAVARASSSR